jgi:hypothetical protein
MRVGKCVATGNTDSNAFRTDRLFWPNGHANHREAGVDQNRHNSCQNTEVSVFDRRQVSEHRKTNDDTSASTSEVLTSFHLISLAHADPFSVSFVRTHEVIGFKVHPAILQFNQDTKHWVRRGR